MWSRRNSKNLLEEPIEAARTGPRPAPLIAVEGGDDPQSYIGRQIQPTQDVLGALSPRSPTMHMKSPRRADFPPVTTRRGSLPAIHLRSASGSSIPTTPVAIHRELDHTPLPQQIPGSEDLYSGLSTFTFGAPRAHQPSPSPSYEADEESDENNSQSPLAYSNRRPSYDRTPRPSVSGPSRQSQQPPMVNRIPARGSIPGPSTSAAKRGSVSSSKGRVSGSRVAAAVSSGDSSSDSSIGQMPPPRKSLSGSIPSMRVRPQSSSTLAGKQKQVQPPVPQVPASYLPTPSPMTSSPSSGVTSSPSSGETSSHASESDAAGRGNFNLAHHMQRTKGAGGSSARQRDSDAASHHTFGGGAGLGSSNSSRASGSRAESIYSAYSRRTEADSVYSRRDDESIYSYRAGSPSDSRRVSISSSRYGMEFSSDEGEAVYNDYHRPSPRIDGDDEYWPVDVSTSVRASAVPTAAAGSLAAMSLHPSVDHRESFYRTLGESSSPPNMGRRPSLPMSIPGTTPPGRDRESSLATLRRPSRSLDDDPNVPTIFSDAYTVGGSLPVGAPQTQSEPPQGGWVARTDWNWQQQVHPSVLSDAIDPLQRLPLDELTRIKDAEEATDDVYQGLNLNYILSAEGDITNDGRRSSDALSYVQRQRQSSAGIGAFSSSWGWGSTTRRPSNATGEDTFDRLVTRWDKDYGVRKGEWSFKREKADGFAGASPTSPLSQAFTLTSQVSRGGASSIFNSSPSTIVGSGSPRPSMQSNVDREKTEKARAERAKARAGMAPGTQEIWRCDFVGRFKVDRTALARQDPNRAPQQRVEMKHIPDPYSKGNTRGGPSSVVHKHSRAVAFSIFRGHRLTNHQRPTVLLAPKRVQEEYTSTKTTSKLSTHGLLEDGSRAPKRADDAGRRRAASMGQPDKRRTDKEREKKDKDKKQRDKEPKKGSGSSGKARESDTASSSHSGDGGGGKSRFDSSLNPPPSSAPAAAVRKQPSSSFPKQPSDALRKHASTRNMRTYSPDVGGSSPAGSSKNSMDSERPSTVRYSHARDRDFDEDDEPPSRTPHSEAFATLDSSTLEYQRGKHHHQHGVDNSGGFLSSFKRVFNQKGSVKSGQYNAGPTSASLEGQYTPPWLTMAPRSRQEEQERVIQNLNESFKDVGLLPSFKTERSNRPKEPKRRVSKPGINIFENVPEDSLYMLLPLWPGETDPASAADEEHLPSQPNSLLADERLYLLVYYVPFGKKPPAGGVPPIKKKQEHSPRSLDASLGAFYVVARLVGYEELRGTGVRLPSEGLSVNGPTALAMENIPLPSMRFDHGDQVICMCEGRDIGMEFVPEGLVKLGLCMPTPEPEPDADPEDEPEVLLSEVGRAAVEMAWLGCMALLSFSAPSAS